MVTQLVGQNVPVLYTTIVDKIKTIYSDKVDIIGSKLANI